MTLFEFVIVFLIGGVIILSTVGNDRSITNCTCAVITIGLMHTLASTLKLKWPRLGAIIDGTPLVIYSKGKWHSEITKGMQIDANDVMAAARGKGIRSIEEIKYAVLERNGSISIVRYNEQR